MASSDDDRAPRLFLVRHGDTEWADAGRHTGLTDVPLSAGGEARARALAGRLAGETFARVFTSPLARARRTCELCGCAGRAEVNADLVEWDYGSYEGRTSGQIRHERPDWELFRDGAPGGESPDLVAARADRFLDVARWVEGDVVAFSSGHFIRVLAARWLALPPSDATFFYTATASVGILGYEHGRADRVILLWNDTRP
ncbi:MAG: putative phosphoglycerate mutase family protein [Phycisphaerales bacterium]|nr:putative phosphoglycerate mutase family protein [Phycisphaerales bacterium]